MPPPTRRDWTLWSSELCDWWPAKRTRQQGAPVTLLEHHRDVLALVMCHKAKVQGVSHLAPLRLLPHTVLRCTRTEASSDEGVKAPTPTHVHNQNFPALEHIHSDHAPCVGYRHTAAHNAHPSSQNSISIPVWL